MTHISLFSGILSGGSILPLNGRDSRQSPRSSGTPIASKCSKNTGPESTDAGKSETSRIKTTEQLPLFPGAIRVLSEVERGQFTVRNIPTCPDISLPWSEESGPDGWSAKMFLHQMLSTSKPRWTCSDTERLLLGRAPLRLQHNAESGILLSEVLKNPGQAKQSSYLNMRGMAGILRRSIKRDRSLLVLLRTINDTIPVTVSFGTEGPELSIPTNASSLVDSLRIGLMDYLTHALQKSQETVVSRSKSTRSYRR